MKEDPEIKNAIEVFENALKNDNKEHYTLRLFVSGMTPGSIRAIKNIKEICKVYLAGRFELEVIDIYQQPELGKSEQIIVAPTLIKKMPLPLKKFIGDLSDRDKVLIGLNVLPKKPGPTD
jgi:circadian clock protein KaiB